MQTNITKGAYHNLSVFFHDLLLIRTYRVSLSSLIDSRNLVITDGQFHQTHGHHTSLVIHINREQCFVPALLVLSKTQYQKEVKRSALFLHLDHAS